MLERSPVDLVDHPANVTRPQPHHRTTRPLGFPARPCSVCSTASFWSACACPYIDANLIDREKSQLSPFRNHNALDRYASDHSCPSNASVPAACQTRCTHGQTFVATHQSKIIGVAVATFTNYGHAPYGVLEELVVDESTRNTGIGRTLLTQALTWLESTGAEVVFVSALNEKAAAFYRSTSFTPCTDPWLFWTPSGPELEPTQSK